MLSLNQDDVKSLFTKEFDFVSSVLNQVKLPERVEDSGKLFYKHVHLYANNITLHLTVRIKHDETYWYQLK